jgi:hypothetical protein
MVKFRSLAVLMVSVTLVGSFYYSAPAAADNSGALFGNPGTGSSKFNVGALAGLGFVSGSLGTQLVLGLNGEYKLAPAYGVGMYFTYNSVSQTSPASGNVLTFAPEANYHFDGLLTGFRVGGKVGLAILNQNTGSAALIPGTTSATQSTTSLVTGPHVGYDYPIMSSVSLGGETNFLFYTASGGFNAFNILGNLKYWF